jgi:hypothetical protein
MRKNVSPANAYRLNARDCLDVAERCQDEPRRTRLLGMALVWLRLAEQAQRNATTDVVYETPPAKA